VSDYPVQSFNLKALHQSLSLLGPTTSTLGCILDILRRSIIDHNLFLRFEAFIDPTLSQWAWFLPRISTTRNEWWNSISI